MTTQTATLPVLPPAEPVLRDLHKNELVAYVGSWEGYHGTVKITGTSTNAIDGSTRYSILTYDDNGSEDQILWNVRRTSLVAPGDPADHVDAE